MTFGTHYTWDKLADELRRLGDEEGGKLAPLALAIHAVLEPGESFEPCFRQLQFMEFQVRETCAALPETGRWQALREYFFEERKFTVSAARLHVTEGEVQLHDVLAHRAGHPLPLTFLVLRLAEVTGLKLGLLHAKHHYLLKWVRPGKSAYLDVFDRCHALSDDQLITVVNRTSSNLETCGARRLISRYLDLLAQAYQRSDRLEALHAVYSLMLNVDDMNITALGHRALLRQRMGMARESLSDLKRYFSFVETNEAPPELREAWLATQEHADGPSGPTGILH